MLPGLYCKYLYWPHDKENLLFTSDTDMSLYGFNLNGEVIGYA